MIKEVYFTGKTLEEAKQTACKELSLDEYLLSYQIVQTPKKGFLGIGSLPAKICVNVEVPDEPKKKEEKRTCILWILAIIGIVAAVAAVAYAVYRYLTPDYLEDFDDDFDDDFEDEDLDKEEPEKEASEEKKED